MKTIKIYNQEVPSVGFGTWDIRGESGLKALRSAIEVGYRHFDTAEMYRNEEVVGSAIHASGLEREEFFITTKAWSNNLTRDEIRRACEDSLSRLDVDYVDLYLIHRPGSAPLEESLAEMHELVSEGKTRYIGVSNFSVDQLERSIEISEEPIFTNQVEYHPFKRRDSLLCFCREKGVLLTAYSPIGHGKVLRDGTLQAIGDRYAKTPAQVALRWLVQQDNVITIPKAASEKHQRENMDIFDFELSEEEMRAIDELGR
ncbi:MAG: aldo/keto reductase [Anaerolineales bacterium]|jgi:diketogulonate reductase-like aldo/keto reductase